MPQLTVVVVTARVYLVVPGEEQSVAVPAGRLDHIFGTEPVQVPRCQNLLLFDASETQLPVHRAAPRIHLLRDSAPALHVVHKPQAITIRGSGHSYASRRNDEWVLGN